MRRTVSSVLIMAALAGAAALAGCAAKPVPYGKESITYAPRYGPRSIAVAPALNLSGESQPDPLLQADIVFRELQQVRGITVVPVNRVVQAYVGLGLRGIESTQQAHAVCDALGVDALLLPTITAFDPYDPPKMGGSVQIFIRRATSASGSVDVQSLRRRATGEASLQSDTRNADFIQEAAMFDAAAGTTRARVTRYARGRIDPTGALGEREFYLNMDRYAAFVWHALIEDALARFE